MFSKNNYSTLQTCCNQPFSTLDCSGKSQRQQSFLGVLSIKFIFCSLLTSKTFLFYLFFFFLRQSAVNLSSTLNILVRAVVFSLFITKGQHL